MKQKKCEALWDFERVQRVGITAHYTRKTLIVSGQGAMPPEISINGRYHVSIANGGHVKHVWGDFTHIDFAVPEIGLWWVAVYDESLEKEKRLNIYFQAQKHSVEVPEKKIEEVPAKINHEEGLNSFILDVEGGEWELVIQEIDHLGVFKEEYKRWEGGSLEVKKDETLRYHALLISAPGFEEKVIFKGNLNDLVH